MAENDTLGNYKLIAIISLIIIFVTYTWLQKLGWMLVINSVINIALSLIGIIILILLIIYSIQNILPTERKFNISKFITIPLLILSLIFLSVSFLKIDYINLDFTDLINKLVEEFQRYVHLMIWLLTIFLIITIIFKILKKRKRDYLDFNEQLTKIKNKNHHTIEQVIDSKNYLKNLIKNNKKFMGKSKTLVKEVGDGLKKRKSTIIEKNIELKQIEEEEIRLGIQKEEDINQLLNYFKKRSSSKSIPKWALKLTKEVINGAQEKFHEFKSKEFELEREIEVQNEEIKQATDYILENKALPANYPELSEGQKTLYLEVFDQFEEGILKPNVEIKPEDKELSKNKFFLTNELSEEQKERFIEDYSYKSYSFTHLNGKLGNNLVIKNNSKTESDYHFCMKHLIARVDELNSQIEYSIKDMRADVGFIFGNKKIAVEIEKGTNNKKQIKKKVDWLNEHFDYWIITAPKKEQKNYRKYVDKKKSFVFGSKKTEEKIVELRGQLQQE